MKTGLLIKEFLVVKKSLTYVVFFGVILSVFAVFTAPDFILQYGMLQIVGTSVIISTFSYDKQAHWEPVVMTFPFSRSQVVLSKYLFALLFLIAMTVINILLLCVTSLINDTAVWPHIQLTIISSLVSLIMYSFMLPVIFKFGVERARIILIIFSSVVFAGTAVISKMRLDIGMLIVSLAAVILLIVSYLISVRIFSHNDF